MHTSSGEPDNSAPISNSSAMPTDAIKVRVDTCMSDIDLRAFLPGGRERLGRCEFAIDPEHAEPCDFWIVYGGLNKRKSLLCPPRNTLFIACEPPAIARCAGRFLTQFHHLVTCDPSIAHPRNHLSYLGLPWHIGLKFPEERFVLSLDELHQIPCPKKTKLVSAICSTKTKVRGHVQRIEFIQRLKSHFGDRIDFFGRGSNPVAMKWEAIAPYRYHIALENSCVPHYWTEKLADAYLGYAYPIYSGCPNISDYLTADSLTPIDVTRTEEAIALIERVIDEDRYSESLESRANARRKILDHYGLFAVMATWVESLYEAHARTRVDADTERSCTPRLKRVVHRLQRAGMRLRGRLAQSESF